MLQAILVIPLRRGIKVKTKKIKAIACSHDCSCCYDSGKRSGIFQYRQTSGAKIVKKQTLVRGGITMWEGEFLAHLIRKWLLLLYCILIPQDMTTIDMRSESHQILDQVDDRFLEVVHAMLQAYARQAVDPVVSYDAVSGTPRTASEFTALLDGEVASVRRGEYMTIEDFKKESAKWGQRIK